MALITKQEYTRIVVYWLAIILGVEPGQITNPRCRLAAVVDARRAVAKYMLDTMNVPVIEVSELLGHGRHGRIGKGMFKFNGEQEWLKGVVIPIMVREREDANNAQATLL